MVERVERAVGSDRCHRYLQEGGAVLRLTGGALEVAAPSRFLAGLLERRFGDALTRAFREEVGDEAAPVRFSVAAVPDAGAAEAASRNERAVREAGAPALRLAPAPRPGPDASWRRLEDFVVGESNRLAFAAASRIAQPEGTQQPGAVFLHGACGVGKTHLLQGVASAYLAARPGARVRYTTGEAFTNAFVSALQARKVDQFRRQHRGLDLLCVDDVHFVAGKTATQNELLHTLEAIAPGGARLVFASDAAPRQIDRLCEKLVSRCMAGVVVRVDPPDAETRLRMLLRLCERRGLAIDPAAARAAAERVQGSAREVEGAVASIEAVHRLLGGGEATVRMATVDRALGTARVVRPRRPIPVRVIAERVAGEMGVALDDLFGRSRHRRVVLARSMTAYLSRELTTQSFPEIARAMNRPNHSTIVTACSRTAKQIERRDPCDDGDDGERTMDDLHRRLRRVVLAAAETD